MTTAIEEFELAVVGSDGETYQPVLHGRSRPHDTWQGWIVFVRQSDGRTFETPVETTQSDREALLYWATGLTDAYFEGALRRALGETSAPATSLPAPAPEPLIAAGVDRGVRAARRSQLEEEILAVFAKARARQLLSEQLFAALPHANADITRGLEHLEKSDQLLIRRTEEGNDWLFLTPAGVRAANLRDESNDTDLHAAD